MSNFKKIDRKFVLSDSSLNVYGFRLLTSGYLIDEFLKNPIGYYNHYSDDGVLVRWEDVKIEGDQVTGYPVINMAHCRGWKTAEEIESGFLNAASVGDIVILEHVFEANPAEPENPILVGTTWYNKETSLVDKPGNRGEVGKEGGAFAEPLKLFDASGQPINLSDLTQKFKPLMKKVQLPINAELVSLLGLSDDGEGADERVILSRIKSLSDKAKKADQLEKDIEAANKAKDTAVKDLADMKAETHKTEVKNLLDKALEEKRLTKALADKFEKEYEGRPKDLDEVLKIMPKYSSIVDDLSDKGEEKIPENFLGKSLMELQAADLLETCKSKYPNLYDKLREEHKKSKAK